MHVDLPGKVTKTTSVAGTDDAGNNLEPHEGAGNESAMQLCDTSGHNQTLESQVLDNNMDQPLAAGDDISGSQTKKRNRSKSPKIRPVCLICNKTFHTNYKLNEHHAVVHLDKRLFSCNVCQKTFGRADHLVRHVKNRVCVQRQQQNATAGFKTGDE